MTTNLTLIIEDFSKQSNIYSACNLTLREKKYLNESEKDRLKSLKEKSGYPDLADKIDSISMTHLERFLLISAIEYIIEIDVTDVEIIPQLMELIAELKGLKHE